MSFEKLIYDEVSRQEVVIRSKKLFEEMQKRRSVRHFSGKPIPLDATKNIVMTASSAPSGANKQPWKYKKHKLANSFLKIFFKKNIYT